MNQTVKETFLEIKELVFGEHDFDVEKYADELSNRSGLTMFDIKEIFNNMYLYQMEKKENRLSSSRDRVWGDGEKRLLSIYVSLSSEEIDANGKKKKKENIFREGENIFSDRTVQSITFRYYNDKKDEKPISKKNDDKDVKSENNADLEVVKSEEVETNDSHDSKMDLLDVVVNLVDNIETAGVEVDSLFGSLLLMSKKAVENSNHDKIEKLESENQFLNDSLEREKQKNESLQMEVARVISEFNKLKDEVNYFNGLDSRDKLKQINSFNDKMKYIVDKFGGVVRVGA